MKRMSNSASVVVVAGIVALAGCASHDAEWVRDDTPRSVADQTLADCKYQAETATATISSNLRPKTFGDAVSEGVAAGVRRGMEEQELIKACMKSKGFTR